MSLCGGILLPLGAPTLARWARTPQGCEPGGRRILFREYGRADSGLTARVTVLLTTPETFVCPSKATSEAVHRDILCVLARDTSPHVPRAHTRRFDGPRSARLRSDAPEGTCEIASSTWSSGVRAGPCAARRAWLAMRPSPVPTHRTPRQRLACRRSSLAVLVDSRFHRRRAYRTARPTP